MKLKDEVGMAGSKSTQTRFVGTITSTIHPYTCFLKGAKTVISSTRKSRVLKEQVRCMMIKKSKHRDVIIPTNLVCVLFDPAIPTSSFNFIQLFLYLYNILITLYYYPDSVG